MSKSKDNNKEDVIVCRCQDITLAEVEEAIEEGITDPEELKRVLHLEMGPCQGRTCGRIVNRLIARHTGKKPEEIKSTSERPPLVGVPIKSVLGGEHE